MDSGLSGNGGIPPKMAHFLIVHPVVSHSFQLVPIFFGKINFPKSNCPLYSPIFPYISLYSVNISFIPTNPKMPSAFPASVRGAPSPVQPEMRNADPPPVATAALHEHTIDAMYYDICTHNIYIYIYIHTPMFVYTNICTCIYVYTYVCTYLGGLQYDKQRPFFHLFTPLRVGWPPTPQVYFGPWEGLRVVFPRGGSPS